MRAKFNPGDAVWVVERDEDGEAYDVSGFIFAAKVGDAAIVTPRVYGCDDLEEIMAYHAKQTAQDWNTDLAVFPVEDCYENKRDALVALSDEEPEED